MLVLKEEKTAFVRETYSIQQLKRLQMGLKMSRNRATLAKQGRETTLWFLFLLFNFLIWDPVNLTATSGCHCGADMPKDAAPALKKFSLSVKNM